MLKKIVNSTIKLQAFGRGFLARKRYQKALSRLRFVDDDDFEYVAVDENEFVLNSLIFEDEYSLFCKNQASKELGPLENLCISQTNSTNANLMVELVEEGNETFLNGSHETCLFPNIGKQKGDIKVAVLCENQSSIKNMDIQCKPTQVQRKSIKISMNTNYSPHLSKKLNAPELTTRPLFDNGFVLPNEVQVLISFNFVVLLFVIIFPDYFKISCSHKFVFI